MPSGPEWFIVLAIVLVFFGGSQLPKLARNLGQAQKEFKDVLAETHREEESKPESGRRVIVKASLRDDADRFSPGGEPR